ncbi:MAG: histidine kinase [Cellvibrionaceae bacterium]|nr:histidine kinase [Cellvibrionaceae bacterium]
MKRSTSALIHDIRNPLNTISINAELGKLTLQKTGDVAKAIQIFETIIAECQLCSKRITELKDSLQDEPAAETLLKEERS